MDPKAFPHQGYTDRDGDSQGYDEGMSLRDYFAAKALQGYMANKSNPLRFDPKGDAEWAYTIADAMMKAREA